MSTTSVIFAIVVLVTVLVVIGTVYAAVRAIRAKLHQASRLISQIQAVTEEAASTPRTISGSEGLMKQRIERDFPEFNVDIARQIVTAALLAYFNSLNQKRLDSNLKDCSTSAFINELEITTQSSSDSFGSPFVHKVVISDYRKASEEAVMTWQAAVQYAFNNRPIAQYVYEVKYVYFLAENAEGENVSLVCENCGAEISVTGAKICEYCGAEIKASVERTWKINKIIKKS